jgi:hypothetical protein
MRVDERTAPAIAAQPGKTFNLRLNLLVGRSILPFRDNLAAGRPNSSTRSTMEDTFPDLGSLSDKELKDLIDNLTAEENEISYKRRVLHGKIDILRAELVNRLRQKRERGDSLISGDDVEQLTNILAGRAQGEDPAA